MTTPFIVYGLGRSRTAWLSKFLSYRDWTCHHDQAIYLKSMRQARDFLAQPNTGTVETAAEQGRYLIRHYFPDVKEVVILRPVNEVIGSFLATGLPFDERHLRRIMQYGHRELCRMVDEPGVLAINYHDLDTEEACKDIFEHCLPYEFDRKWWQSLRGKNIQINLNEMLTYFQQHRQDIDSFKKDCKSDMRRLYRAGELMKRRA